MLAGKVQDAAAGATGRLRAAVASAWLTEPASAMSSAPAPISAAAPARTRSAGAAE